MHRAVYRVGPLPSTYEESLQAAIACADHRALLSHRAAAWAHGLDGVERKHHVVELTVRRERRHVDVQGAVVHSAQDVPHEDRCTANGFPCTSLPRTLVDLSELGDRKLLVKSYEHAYRKHHRSWPELTSAIRRIARGRAAADLLQLMSRRIHPAMTESGAEAWCDDLMWNAGIRTTRQVEVFDDHGDFIGRVDFAIRKLRFAIEYDGWEFHKHRGVQDRRRWRALQRVGWFVAPFTKTDLDDERRFIAELHDMIHARERQLEICAGPMPTHQLDLGF